MKSEFILCTFPGCGKSITKRHYKWHSDAHNNIRPFSCKWEGCISSFKRSAHLKEHLNIHLDVTFACSDCTKVFNNEANRNKHIKESHLQIRENTCQVCNLSFKRAHHLILHTRSHTDERPFSCDFPDCIQTFSQKSNMQSHRTSHVIGKGKSKGEAAVYTELKKHFEHGVIYYQKTFPDLKGESGHVYRFDFGLEMGDTWTLIEYDGAFHFQQHPAETESSFERRKARDVEKNEYCKKKGYELIRIIGNVKLVGDNLKKELLDKGLIQSE